jgi:hypothetical protein
MGLRSAQGLSFSKIVQKLRGGNYTCDKQVIPGTRTCDIEEMPLGIVDLLQVGIVPDRFDIRQRTSGSWMPTSMKV